jgi:hypothetical protein
MKSDVTLCQVTHAVKVSHLMGSVLVCGTSFVANSASKWREEESKENGGISGRRNPKKGFQRGLRMGCALLRLL